MKKIIHHLRKQSDEAKRHFIHMFVLVCGVILILFWIYSLGRTVTDEDVQNSVVEDFGQLTPLVDDREIPEIW